MTFNWDKWKREVTAKCSPLARAELCAAADRNVQRGDKSTLLDWDYGEQEYTHYAIEQAMEHGLVWSRRVAGEKTYYAKMPWEGVAPPGKPVPSIDGDMEKATVWEFTGDNNDL